jgi:nicotinamidase-related amidase
MSDEIALLVIDTQVNMFDDEMPVFEGDRILETIKSLVARARAKGIPVIYIRNDGGSGEPDEHGTPGWEIHPFVGPQPGDIVIDKTSPNAFQGTNLEKEIKRRGIEKLVIAGMQTEYCIDATSRGAAQLGYEVIVVEDGHTTFDFEEMSASEAIAKYNVEFAEFATVAKASDINFN